MLCPNRCLTIYNSVVTLKNNGKTGLECEKCHCFYPRDLQHDSHVKTYYELLIYFGEDFRIDIDHIIKNVRAGCRDYNYNGGRII